ARVSATRCLLVAGLHERRAPQLPGQRDRTVGARFRELLESGAKLGGQEIADGFPVARHERRNVDEPGNARRMAIGELRDEGATEAVADEHDGLRVRRLLQGDLGGAHIVREGDTADVLGRVGMRGQRRRQHTVAACLEGGANAVPAPAALPGTVHEKVRELHLVMLRWQLARRNPTRRAPAGDGTGEYSRLAVSRASCSESTTGAVWPAPSGLIRDPRDSDLDPPFWTTTTPPCFRSSPTSSSTCSRPPVTSGPPGSASSCSARATGPTRSWCCWRAASP